MSCSTLRLLLRFGAKSTTRNVIDIMFACVIALACAHCVCTPSRTRCILLTEEQGKRVRGGQLTKRANPQNGKEFVCQRQSFTPVCAAGCKKGRGWMKCDRVNNAAVPLAESPVPTQVADCILSIKPGRPCTRSSVCASNVNCRPSAINNS